MTHDNAVDVFLSYARADQDRALAVVEALQAAGLRVYWDKNLDFGAQWLNEINAHLDAASAIMVIWSPHSVQSSFVQAEALKGYERNALVPMSFDGAKPPTPFGIVQTAAFEGRLDSGSPEWSKMTSRVRDLVASAKTKGVRMSASMLSDSVRAARLAAQSRIKDIITPIRDVALDPAVGQKTAAEVLGGVVDRLSRDDLFTIAVVGRMKGGKSTLLNALLGTAEGGQSEPLPAETNPCTATIVRLRYSDTPYCRPFSWDKDRHRPGEPLPDWSFDDFHRKARIYQDGRETNIFDGIAEFEVGWPSPLLRAGVSLMDTPGISENPERTALTRAALVGVDAAVVVYRSEPLAGTDELEFAEEVTARTGKVFTLINLRGDDTMPPSNTLQNVVRSRLKVTEGASLSEQDIYFGHFKDGLKASIRGDGALSQASGLGAFQARLATFLITERYKAHLLKAVKEIFPIARPLERVISGLSAGAQAEVGALRKAVEACRDDLASIERRRANINNALNHSKLAASAAAVRSFEAEVGQIANRMNAQLEKMSLGLEGGDKLYAGTIGNKKWVERTCKKIEMTMQKELEAWSSNPADAPGLARDLKPVMDGLSAALENEAREIAATLERMRSRISDLKPATASSGQIVSDEETITSLVLGTLVFGPLGLAGLGGWRGIVGAVGGAFGGGLVLGLATVLLGLTNPAGWAVLTAGILGSVGGAIFGSTAGVENRLKKAAWKAVEPKWRELARDSTASVRINSAIESWFDSIHADIADGLGRLVAAEQQTLSRLDNLSRDSQSKGELIADLDRKMIEIQRAIQSAEVLERELEGFSPDSATFQSARS